MRGYETMTGDERLNAFIDSLDTGNTPFLNEIEKEEIGRAHV